MSMSGKKAKMGDFMKQKWPCILTCNLNANQESKSPIFAFLPDIDVSAIC